MSYKPGDFYTKEFVTSSPTTGAAMDADSLPVATADLDGSGSGAMALTVTHVDTGRYKITGIIPIGRVKGDVLNVSVAATVGGVAGKAIVDTQVIDSKRVGDLNDSPYNGGAVAGVTAPVTVGTNNDKTAYKLASDGWDAITIETGVNARQALSPILAASGGVLAGAPGGPITIKGGNVATTRITATVDSSGNRTGVTLNLPS